MSRFVLLSIFLLAATLASAQTVLVEEDVYPTPRPDNGSGVMWCNASACVVRVGDEVFVTQLETVPDAKPLNNCRWKLLRRNASGWTELHADRERTREPSPLVVFSGEKSVFVSANPTLVEDRNAYNGPARPEFVRFSPPSFEPQTLRPVWDGEPKFTEHSYRSTAADGANREAILFQNIGYTHAEWSFFDRTGKWFACGKLVWPWGEDYVKPCPVRICYPAVALRDRKVFFCGVSDIVEPNPEWAKFKEELTGRKWDYDFRRLFFTWTNDVSSGKFEPWIEVASREKTCGWIMPCDLCVAPDGETVHLLWTERGIDVRLREKFFPDEKQSESLNHAVLRGGTVLRRNTLVVRNEGEQTPVAATGRFHATPDGRLWCVCYVNGTEKDPEGRQRNVAENRIVEVTENGAIGPFRTIPLAEPLTAFFTASVRAGNEPSWILDLLGHTSKNDRVRYAAVRLEAVP